jgi:ABC-type nitrate/sulfonate/bicarbonate transport system substrate-binding protein
VNTRGFLQANGVDGNSVKFIVIQDATGAPQALERGDYDAWAGNWTAVYTNDGTTGYNFTTVGNASTKAWSDPEATTAGFWATGDYLRGHPEVGTAFTKALYDFHVWWNTVSPAEQAALVLQHYKVDYSKIAGGNDQKLRNLLPTYYQTGPINLAATQTWYQLGLTYASDKIAKDVDWQAQVSDSAKQS